MNIREALFPTLFALEMKKKDLLVAAISQIPANAFTNAAPLARKNDPATSKAAAESLTKSGARDSDKKKVLHWLKLATHTNHLFTSAELAKLSELPHPTVHKRLPDLRRDGLVENGPSRICSVTGRVSLTWKAK